MKKFFKEMFSREPLNIGRQIEVDIAKAICIIGMIFVHAFEEIPYIVGSGGTGEFILMRVGNTIFGATLFMFCMGVGMSYTKKNSPNLIMIRGVTIFAVGLFLNFFRSVLGSLIANAVHPGSYSTFNIFGQLLSNDILFFAGLAMILFGLLKKLKIPGWGILLISVAMSVLGTIFKGLQLENFYANVIVGWFIGTVYPNGTTSYFPLLNWFMLVAAGYCFAWILKRISKKGRFYMVFSTISAIFIGLYIGLSVGPKFGYFQKSFTCTFHITTLDACVSMCGAIFAYGLFYGLSHILPNLVLKGATTMSKYINTIYCIQWLIYGNLKTIFQVCTPDLVFEPWKLVLIAVGILVFSVSVAWLYKGVILKSFKKDKEVHA